MLLKWTDSLLQGNDGANGNLSKKLSYCTEHLGQKDCWPRNNHLILGDT